MWVTSFYEIEVEVYRYIRSKYRIKGHLLFYTCTNRGSETDTKNYVGLLYSCIFFSTDRPGVFSKNSGLEIKKEKSALMASLYFVKISYITNFVIH